jgi:hypothetical protein
MNYGLINSLNKNHTSTANNFGGCIDIELSDGGSSYLISRFENSFSQLTSIIISITIPQRHLKPIEHNNVQSVLLSI